MDAAVERYCPVLEQLGRYHWSIMQAEYAPDIIFRSAATLAPLYDHLLRTAILAVKVSDVATFLGRSPNRPTDRGAGSDFSIRHHGLRIEGKRVRHYFGPASIKMYDKHGFILRVETTTNDVTTFLANSSTSQARCHGRSRGAFRVIDGLTSFRATSDLTPSGLRTSLYSCFASERCADGWSRRSVSSLPLLRKSLTP